MANNLSKYGSATNKNKFFRSQSLSSGRWSMLRHTPIQFSPLNGVNYQKSQGDEKAKIKSKDIEKTEISTVAGAPCKSIKLFNFFKIFNLQCSILTDRCELNAHKREKTFAHATINIFREMRLMCTCLGHYINVVCP